MPRALKWLNKHGLINNTLIVRTTNFSNGKKVGLGPPLRLQEKQKTYVS